MEARFADFPRLNKIPTIRVNQFRDYLCYDSLRLHRLQRESLLFLNELRAPNITFDLKIHTAPETSAVSADLSGKLVWHSEEEEETEEPVRRHETLPPQLHPLAWVSRVACPKKTPAGD